jgi:hypothetical protein
MKKRMKNFNSYQFVNVIKHILINNHVEFILCNRILNSSDR